jgi:hypothetical protein
MGWGSGFTIYDSGFRTKGSGLRILGFRFWILVVGLRVEG